MNAVSPPRRWPEIAGRIAGACVFVAGIVVLLGWCFDVLLLKSILPEWPKMSPLTAVTFALAGISLWCVVSAKKNRESSRVSYICAALVTFNGLFKLSEGLFGWHAGIDNLGFHEAANVSSPAQMASPTALNFLLLGSALLLAGSTQLIKTFQFLTVSASLVGWFGFFRFLYGGAAPAPFAAMAVHTAGCFLLLGAGVFCSRTDGGLMKLLVSNSAGGLIARRLMLPIILIPLAMSWLETQIAHTGWFREGTQSSLFTINDIIVFSALVWLNALLLDRTDTKRRRMEEERAQLAKIVESSNDAIIGKDLNGVITSWNKGAERLFGFTADEMVKTSIMRLIPSNRNDEESHILSKIRSGESVEHFETQRLTRDGRIIHVSITASPIKDVSGKVTGASKVARDITERKQAESRLKTQFATAKAINESVDVTGATSNILQGICENLKWDIAQLFLLDEAADVLRCAATYQMPSNRIQDFVVASHKMEFAIGIGLPGRVMLSRKPAWISDITRDKNFPRAIAAEKDGLHGAFAFPVQAGEKFIGVLEMFSREIRDSVAANTDLDVLTAIGGQIAQFIERKHSEDKFKKAAEQLRQSQKLEGIGQLAGGIAHDFNNLLTVINGRSQLSINRFKPGDKTRNDLELIYKTGERAAALTRQLLAFSRQQVLEPVVLDLNAVATDMDTMLRRLIREDIDLLTVLDPALKRVNADPGQIEQVIMNLVVNARDAMPDGGKLTVETANVELTDEYCRTRTDLKPGRYVRLGISDTGSGMDVAVKARIFEPFFTTKPLGQGTGLGLATVFGVVKQSNGHIEVYSEVGKGTTFKVYLPQSLEKAVASAAEIQPRMTPGHEVILVVEDDEEVRELVRELLEMNGYTVSVAKNGNEALQICQRLQGAIALVITDVVMPEIGGPELAARLKLQHPKIKVLFTSGYTDHAIVRNGALEPGITFIQKPFTPANLARKVREVLDKEYA